MKKILSETDRDHLNRIVTETEKSINAQIVLAVIKRSDSYAEIPWKAFALGASMAGLITFVLNVMMPFWDAPSQLLIAIVSVLASGICFAALSVVVPQFARLFLSKHRAKEEVKQFAGSVFLERELYATGNRSGILLLVSLFERRVFLLPDKGLTKLFGKDEIRSVIDPMVLLLRQNEVRMAFEEGLNQLSVILKKSDHPLSFNSKNELSNEIIEEEGK